MKASLVFSCAVLIIGFNCSTAFAVGPTIFQELQAMTEFAGAIKEAKNLALNADAIYFLKRGIVSCSSIIAKRMPVVKSMAENFARAVDEGNFIKAEELAGKIRSLAIDISNYDASLVSGTAAADLAMVGSAIGVEIGGWIWTGRMLFSKEDNPSTAIYDVLSRINSPPESQDSSQNEERITQMKIQMIKNYGYVQGSVPDPTYDQIRANGIR